MTMLEKPTAQGRRSSGGASPRYRLIVTIATIALLTSGCGGDDGNTETFSDPVTDFLATTTMPNAESDLVDDIVEALAAQARIPRSDEQLRCVAEAAVAAVGAEQLIAAGAPAPGTFDGTLLDEAGQSALIAEVIACGDGGSLLMDPDVVGVPISPESVACLQAEAERTGIVEDVIRAAVASGPDQALASNMVPIVETLGACLTVQEIARVVESFGLVSFLP